MEAKVDRSLVSFYNKTHCDRCGASLKDKGRILSWFNDECLCVDNCAAAETWIKQQLYKQGHNPLAYEGCGYVPEVWKDEKICRSGTRTDDAEGRQGIGQVKKVA